MATIYDTGLIYDTGVIYPLELRKILHYRANPFASDVIENEFVLLRYIQCRVRHAFPSLLEIHRVRLHAQALNRTRPVYVASVGELGFQRLTVRVKHAGATNFALYELRAHVKIAKGRVPRDG